jgi:hypothetical protein
MIILILPLGIASAVSMRHDLAVLDHRQVVIATIMHRPQRIDRSLARRHCVRVRRHYLGALPLGGVPCLSQNPDYGIAPGEDAKVPLERPTSAGFARLSMCSPVISVIFRQIRLP